MKIKVKQKQSNSKNCLVCGMKNPLSLKSRFYELENGELVSIFVADEHHQGYPGRMHGGMATAILDETIGRTVMHSSEGEIWGVTIDLQVSFKKPVPIGEEIKVVGRITKQGSRIFEGTGELYLPDGTVAVSAEGRYLRMPLEKIADFDPETAEWRVIESHDDPEMIEIPINNKE